MEGEDNVIKLLTKLKDDAVKEYSQLSQNYDILDSLYIKTRNELQAQKNYIVELKSKVDECMKENEALKEKIASLNERELLFEEKQSKEEEKVEHLKTKLKTDRAKLKLRSKDLDSSQSELDKKQKELLVEKDNWKRERGELLEKLLRCQEKLNEYQAEEIIALRKHCECSKKLEKCLEDLCQCKVKCEQYRCEIKELKHELADTTRNHYDIIEVLLIREALDVVAKDVMSFTAGDKDNRDEVWNNFFSKREKKAILDQIGFSGNVREVLNQIFNTVNKNIHEYAYKKGMKVRIRETSFSPEQQKLIRAAWIVGNLPKGTLIITKDSVLQ